MPDCHSGSGCVIGFTAPILHKAIVPNIVGVDIACGVNADVYSMSRATDQEFFEKIDEEIRQNIPSGFSIHSKRVNTEHSLYKEMEEVCKMTSQDFERQCKAVGTLGGGNHFIEIGKSINSAILVASVHSGSRNFGLQIAKFFQSKAEKNKNHADKNLCWIEGQDYEDYLFCSEVAYKFASSSRKHMLSILQRQIENFELRKINSIESTHNYVDTNKMIRKGAIKAEKGQSVLIPLNMRDGMIMAIGKGNEDWNNSAPHGAGRTMSRSQAKKEITLESYKQSMVGIYSTCVSNETVDEAPMAYKPANDILDIIGETVSDIHIVKPVYNFKAEEKRKW